MLRLKKTIVALLYLLSSNISYKNKNLNFTYIFLIFAILVTRSIITNKVQSPI